MKRCPLLYIPISQNQLYSVQGLKSISPKLTGLALLPFSAAEQRREAVLRAEKMSIQGVQSKLSARLSKSNDGFEIVDHNGSFILKPQSELFEHLPENEDLTMKMAKEIGIKTPLHGLVYAKDMSLTYFIKRFDRLGRHEKLSVEDFAQLIEATRTTKYDSTMERIAACLDRFATFPMIEKSKLFKLTLFCYLTGNEDMHLKNFSLIREGDIISFSPAYDLLNTSLALKNPKEELALTLRGKKNKLTKEDFLNYFAKDRLLLPDKIIMQILEAFLKAKPTWQEWIQNSFLSAQEKQEYTRLLDTRWSKLFS